jgi:hypothetical protein
MDPIPTLLEAIHVLHQRGHERLKVYAYVYGTGHWRCTLGIVGLPMPEFDDTFNYSDAAGWQFFSAATEPDILHDRSFLGMSPGDLADLLHQHHAKLLKRAQAKCRPYAVWYELLLEACGPDGWFVMAEDYFDAREEGYVQVHRRDARARFPLAPAF